MKLHIEECRKQAIDLLSKHPRRQEVKIGFLLCGESGKTKAIWLDPWLGIFQTEGSKGFMMAVDVPSYLWCEELATAQEDVTSSAPQAPAT